MVTPGSTAPDVSLTTPAIEPCAEARTGIRTAVASSVTTFANLPMDSGSLRPRRSRNRGIQQWLRRRRTVRDETLHCQAVGGHSTDICGTLCREIRAVGGESWGGNETEPNGDWRTSCRAGLFVGARPAECAC